MKGMLRKAKGLNPVDKSKKRAGVNTNIAKPSVHIIVKRLMGDMPVTIAQFTATQEKDSDYNLKLIHKDNDFKEDITVVQHKVIDLLNYKLDLSKKTTKEKLDIVTKAIGTQEELIKNIKDGLGNSQEDGYAEDKEGKSKQYNIIDEEYRLSTLKSLKFIVRNASKGTYEEINSEGYRQISYLLTDGLLVPYFHASTNITLYPDVGSKRKLYKERQDMIEQDYLDENKGLWGGWFLGFMKILFIALFVFNIWWAMENQADRSELTTFLDDSAFAKLMDNARGSYLHCSELASSDYETNKELIEFSKIYLKLEGEKYLKDSSNVILE